MNKFYKEITTGEFTAFENSVRSAEVDVANFTDNEINWLADNILYPVNGIYLPLKSVNLSHIFFELTKKEGYDYDADSLSWEILYFDKIKKNTITQLLGRFKDIKIFKNRIFIDNDLYMTLCKLEDDWYYLRIPMIWSMPDSRAQWHHWNKPTTVTKYYKCDGFRAVKILLQDLNQRVRWQIKD